MENRSSFIIAMSNQTNLNFIDNIQNIDDYQLKQDIVELLNNFNTSFDNITGITYRSITDIDWNLDYNEPLMWLVDFLDDQDVDTYKFIRIGDDTYNNIDIRGYLYDKNTNTDILKVNIKVIDSHRTIIF